MFFHIDNDNHDGIVIVIVIVAVRVSGLDYDRYINDFLAHMTDWLTKGLVSRHEAKGSCCFIKIPIRDHAIFCTCLCQSYHPSNVTSNPMTFATFFPLTKTPFYQYSGKPSSNPASQPYTTQNGYRFLQVCSLHNAILDPNPNPDPKIT